MLLESKLLKGGESQEQSFFSMRLDSPDQGKRKLSQEKKLCQRDSISEKPLFCSMDLFFVLLMHHDPKSAF